MPQRKSGVDELRKNRKRRMHNLDIKTDLKKAVKAYTSALEAKKNDEAQTTLKTIYKKIDKAAKRNVFKKNTADRRKSRYARMLNTAAK